MQNNVTTKILTLIRRTYEHFHHHKDISCCHVMATPTPFHLYPWTQPLATNNLFSISKFVMVKMLFQWNYTLWKLWTLALLFTQNNFLEIHSLLHVLIIHSFSLLNRISCYEFITVCLIVHLLKDVCVGSSLDLLEMKLL